MKKSILFSAFVIMLATVVNAAPVTGGVASKKVKPKTLEQACSQAEIKIMCPAVAAGTQDIGDCGVESIDGVSEKCSKFVKLAISRKNNPNHGAAKPKTIKGTKKKSSGTDMDAATLIVPVASESN